MIYTESKSSFTFLASVSILILHCMPPHTFDSTPRSSSFKRARRAATTNNLLSILSSNSATSLFLIARIAIAQQKRLLKFVFGLTFQHNHFVNYVRKGIKTIFFLLFAGNSSIFSKILTFKKYFANLNFCFH